MAPGRKKCVIRACPHHHFSLDKIAGTPIRPLSFPNSKFKRMQWLEFVYKFNLTILEPTKQDFLCSAHFTPDSFINDKLKASAVPTIDPESVRKLAIENGDMRPVVLDTRVTIKNGEVLDSPSVVYLQEMKEVHNQDVSDSYSNPMCKRRRIGDLCATDFTTQKGIKIALQLVNSTLKVWSGTGVVTRGPGNSKVAGGKEVEVVEKCEGDCYAQCEVKENAENFDSPSPVYISDSD